MSKQLEIEIHHQAAFGDDGELEITEKSVETSFVDFGVEVDFHECKSRLDRPETSQFGIDDRPERQQSSESDQSKLFIDTAVDQRTLTGDEAATRCLYKKEPMDGFDSQS